MKLILIILLRDCTESRHCKVTIFPFLINVYLMGDFETIQCLILHIHPLSNSIYISGSHRQQYYSGVPIDIFISLIPSTLINWNSSLAKSYSFSCHHLLIQLFILQAHAYGFCSMGYNPVLSLFLLLKLFQLWPLGAWSG